MILVIIALVWFVLLMVVLAFVYHATKGRDR